MRAVLLVAGLVLAAPSIARAEVINLSCSGNYFVPGTPPVNLPVVNQGIRVDLETKQVFGLYSTTFPITRVSPTDIEFSQNRSFEPGVAGWVGGTLDRITGKLSLQGLKSLEPMVLLFGYNFDCRPAKPIF